MATLLGYALLARKLWSVFISDDLFAWRTFIAQALSEDHFASTWKSTIAHADCYLSPGLSCAATATCGFDGDQFQRTFHSLYFLSSSRKWGILMRAFMMAVAAAIVFAFLGFYGVNKIWQQTADQAFSSSMNVRLSHEDAGHNLVAKDWSSAKEH